METIKTTLPKLEVRFHSCNGHCVLLAKDVNGKEHELTGLKIEHAWFSKFKPLELTAVIIMGKGARPPGVVFEQPGCDAERREVADSFFEPQNVGCLGLDEEIESFREWHRQGDVFKRPFATTSRARLLTITFKKDSTEVECADLDGDPIRDFPGA